MRDMRKSNRLLSDEKVQVILDNTLYGVLSLVGPEGPYGVPLSYVYVDNCIYFHAAKVGHKLDCIDFEKRASFCVVTDVETMPVHFTTKYKSVIAFGKMAMVDDESERNLAFRALVKKYSPEFIAAGEEYMKKGAMAAVIFKLNVESMAGKGRE